MRHQLVSASLFLGVLLSGCGAPPSARLPMVAEIYREAALDEVRNPVVVLHGILGARLEQPSSNRVVWGAFTKDAIDPSTPEGARALALPLEPGAMDDVVARGPVGSLDVDLFFGIVSVDVYASILRALGNGGYRDSVVDAPEYAEDHFTCHSFFYDWRLDNVTNAQRLGAYLEETRTLVESEGRARLARLRAEGDDAEAARVEAWLDRGIRFDLVAHSMGGLVSRYFLRYGTADLPDEGPLPDVTWAGSDLVDRLFVVGTPHLGSMDALQNLVNGFDPGPFLPRYEPCLLGTLPSLYQLLPRPRHDLVRDENGQPLELDFLDPEVWMANGWGLADPDAAPYLDWLGVDRQTALSHLRWSLSRAARFHAALDQPAAPPRTQIIGFVADAEPTLTRVQMRRRGDGSLRPVFKAPGLHEPGDGTVSRYSATADERFGESVRARLRSPIPWSHVTFLSDDHLGLTRNPHFIDNLLFDLLERPLPGDR